MPNRFEQLYSLPDNLYSGGSPVILSKGVLSKDSQTGSIIIQLKFHNVSTQTIKALKVSIITYDITGAEIEGLCDYQYLDLKIKPGEDFGSKKAIIVSNSVSRSFNIKNITVVMGQDAVQEVSMPLEPLPEPDTLQNSLNDPKLVKQYQLTVSSKATFVPQEVSSLWQCSCGEWNSETTCTKCHAEKAKAFSSLDISFLYDEIKRRKEKETAEAEKRKVEEEKAEAEKQKKQEEFVALEIEKKKKRNHIIIGASVTLAVILIAVIIVLIIVGNQPKFESEEAMIEFTSGTYIEYRDDEPYQILNIDGSSESITMINITNNENFVYQIYSWDPQAGTIQITLLGDVIVNRNGTVKFWGGTYKKVP